MNKKNKKKGFQLAYRILYEVPEGLSDIPGYRLEITENDIFWISERPTHYFNHKNGMLNSIDGISYPLPLSVTLVGPVYDTLEELYSSLKNKQNKSSL